MSSTNIHVRNYKRLLAQIEINKLEIVRLRKAAKFQRWLGNLILQKMIRNPPYVQSGPLPEPETLAAWRADQAAMDEIRAETRALESKISALEQQQIAIPAQLRAQAWAFTKQMLEASEYL